MSGRQLSFMPENPDEDGDQMDLIEEAGTEVLTPASILVPACEATVEVCGPAGLAGSPREQQRALALAVIERLEEKGETGAAQYMRALVRLAGPADGLRIGRGR
jgi:hypothetical protein